MNPSRLFYGFLISILCSSSAIAQDTFSIVAVDTVTGEIGSAGASCISNSKIISSIVSGIGAIHTQAQYMSGNQQNGTSYMEEGKSPDEIIQLLKINDVTGDSTIRQYGVVVLRPGKRTAAYSGDSCLDYKNHITGATYSIQGNILLGQHVLDSMEARFKRETRSLEFKLMAALQGANIPGADSRCLADGKPAISAFLRLARPGDVSDYYIDLNVGSTKKNQNPIDSLQKKFDKFISQSTAIKENKPAVSTSVFPNPANASVTFHYFSADNHQTTLSLVDASGKLVFRKALPYGIEYTLPTEDLPQGLYCYQIQTQAGSGSGKLLISR